MFPFSYLYSHPYSICERLLRTCVFQIGVAQNVYEKYLMWIYQAFSSFSCFPNTFDPDRAQSKLNVLINLGAEVEFITPRDGMAKIQMMTLRSEDLENLLLAHDAKWEKISITENGESKEIIAIIPPKEPTIEWKSIEQGLAQLKWSKRTVAFNGADSREVIVTCENASKINGDEFHNNVFLHVNSASVCFVMLTQRMGFYLGCKQNICFYDPRGTWKSSGIASEAGYYNDVYAVYNKVKDGYQPENIWVSTACGGSCTAAYLKSETHGTGVNYIFENGFSDLKEDFVEPEGAIISTFASQFWAGLASRDIPQQVKPIETGFNVAALWKDLKLTDIGKVAVISVENDQRLSRKTAQRNEELARRINENVLSISFLSKSKDPHADRYFKYSEPANTLLSYIFDR